MSFNYGNMMKQARIMQQKLQDIKEELKEMIFEASAGGGVVKVKVNGEQEVIEIKINKEMVDSSDMEMIEDMVMVAVNDAIRQSREEAKRKMAALTGGINIPGMF
ncbi:MAG: YbaB/EbfC family nucleoid-associated protein [Actinomycetota bacterium]|nr:YbaB/EbfC family nucleoid-associated protein [Actinomycetota bacterium]MDD5600924.1 YbaB/EbfC family nucleoid-associated protein [Actinomycetota bacterium]